MSARRTSAETRSPAHRGAFSNSNALENCPSSQSCWTNEIDPDMPVPSVRGRNSEEIAFGLEDEKALRSNFRAGCPFDSKTEMRADPNETTLSGGLHSI